MDRKKDDVGTIQTSIAIDAETHRQLTELARRGGMSMSAAATHAIAVLWANSSFYWNASKQTELSILAPVVVPDAKSPVQVANPASSRQVVSIDESTSDRLHERKIAWVAGMVRREIKEFLGKYEEIGKDYPRDVAWDLNAAVFRCASYHEHLSDDFERLFAIAGQRCGIEPVPSLQLVRHAMRDAREKNTPAKVPNINNETQARARKFNAPAIKFDAADAAAGILDQLRGPRSSS